MPIPQGFERIYGFLMGRYQNKGMSHDEAKKRTEAAMNKWVHEHPTKGKKKK